MCCPLLSPCRTLGHGWVFWDGSWVFGVGAKQPCRTLVAQQAACLLPGTNGAEPSRCPPSHAGLWSRWCDVAPVSKTTDVIYPLPCPRRAGRGGLCTLCSRGLCTPLALCPHLPRGLLPRRQPRAAQQSLQEVRCLPSCDRSKARTDGEHWQG